MGKSYWLKGQYKKDVGVGGGSSGARQGEGHGEGGSAFSSWCPPTPFGSMAAELPLAFLFTGYMTLP